MILRDLLIPTATAYQGMTVGDMFAECFRSGVPGLPFCDSTGHIIGKASIRHVLKTSWMPDYLVQHSHVLGDTIDHLHLHEEQWQKLLASDVADYAIDDFASIGVEAPVSKALARMEQHDTTYAFVRDEGRYLGTITVYVLARYLYDRARSL